MAGKSPVRTDRPRALDAELAALQVMMPDVDIEDVQATRTTETAIADQMHSVYTSAQVESFDVICPRTDEDGVAARFYRPRSHHGQVLPILLFIHGGSFVSGGLHTEDSRCAGYAVEAECVVVAVDYRLAPEHPFPAGLDDCHHVLTWLMSNAELIGGDRTRMAVGGLSAGGALAAGLAARLRDEHRPAPLLQLLLFPVLDASATTASATTFADTPIITSATVRSMWRMYLGVGWPNPHGTPPQYASPVHIEDLAGLPAVYLCTAEFDPLRDEALRYAQMLMLAGVPVDLRVYSRAFHSFDSFEAARLAKTARRDQIDALRRVFGS